MPTETNGSETAEIFTQTAFFLPVPVGLNAPARQPIKKDPFGPFSQQVLNRQTSERRDLNPRPLLPQSIRDPLKSQ